MVQSRVSVSISKSLLIAAMVASIAMPVQVFADSSDISWDLDQQKDYNSRIEKEKKKIQKLEKDLAKLDEPKDSRAKTEEEQNCNQCLPMSGYDAAALSAKTVGEPDPAALKGYFGNHTTGCQYRDYAKRPVVAVPPSSCALNGTDFPDGSAKPRPAPF